MHPLTLLVCCEYKFTSNSDSTNYSMAGVKTLKDQVEELLPNWRSWYPSLFHAAEDLGVIRARVCDPDSLNLSRRHASVQNEALQEFREKWGGHEKLNND
jgi:hypothetical protein